MVAAPNKARIVALALALAAIPGCGGGPSEADAKAELETRGFTEIALVSKTSIGFDFTAKLGGAPCTGKIEIGTSSGARKVDVQQTCGKRTTTTGPNRGLVCTPEDPKDCTRLASIAEDAKKYTTAIELLEKGCAAKEPTACNNLGFLLDHGAEGIPLDRKRALEAYEKACDLGYGKSCVNRGNLYANADPPDDAKALELYVKACDQKETNGCVAAGWAYALGKGTKVDDKIAYEVFDKGCAEGSERACGALGSRIALGLGTEKNVQRGVEMMRVSCDTGVAGETCTNLGVLLSGDKLGKPDPTAAHEAFEKGCTARDGGACKAAGNDFANGTGTTVDLPQALARYRSGCDIHDLGACVLAGQMLRDGKGTDKDPALAAKLFDVGCNAGWKVACDERKTVP